jgi:hypothetical protein
MSRKDEQVIEVFPQANRELVACYLAGVVPAYNHTHPGQPVAYPGTFRARVAARLERRLSTGDWETAVADMEASVAAWRNAIRAKANGAARARRVKPIAPVPSNALGAAAPPRRAATPGTSAIAWDCEACHLNDEDDSTCSFCGYPRPRTPGTAPEVFDFDPRALF